MTSRSSFSFWARPPQWDNVDTRREEIFLGVWEEGLAMVGRRDQRQHVRTLFWNGMAVFVLARIPAGLSLKARVNA